MTYLVLECGLSYAVVLSDDGRYLTVPNLGYQVGETLSEVVVLPEVTPEPRRRLSMVRGRALRALAAAACLCALAAGGAAWQSPMGTVHMSINPEVSADVNRFDRVVALEGDNDDGQALVDGYWAYGKDIRTVTNELADRAEDMGYLDEDGTIEIDVTSQNDEWRIVLEDQLIEELVIHVDGSVTVQRYGAGAEKTGEGSDDPMLPAAGTDEGDDGDDKRQEVVVPTAEAPEQPQPATETPTAAAPSNQAHGDDDDDWDDNGWDSDDDDDDWDDDEDDDDDDDDED